MSRNEHTTSSKLMFVLQGIEMIYKGRNDFFFPLLRICKSILWEKILVLVSVLVVNDQEEI